MPADTIADELGLNIRAEMGRQRLSMAELSRRTGVSRTTLAYQIDVSGISASNLVLIAQALGLQPADLLPRPIDAAS
jgi:lambda repressor-like predicted transcriptional regulator